MLRGRNTIVFGVRVADSVHARIKALAGKQGLTVSEWCKLNLVRAAGLLPSGQVRLHHKKSTMKRG
ncbi:hypothetical protein ES703_47521 [subsurface metagenome]